MRTSTRSMRGTMIVDRFGFQGDPVNATVVTDYPEPAFFALLAERLG